MCLDRVFHAFLLTHKTNKRQQEQRRRTIFTFTLASIRRFYSDMTFFSHLAAYYLFSYALCMMFVFYTFMHYKYMFNLIRNCNATLTRSQLSCMFPGSNHLEHIHGAWGDISLNSF